MNLSKNDALIQIKSLILKHSFTQADILALFSTDSMTEESQSGGLLQRVIMYIGAAFIFMGICVYIGMIWDTLNPLSRIIISLGSGFIAFILGLFSLGDAKFSKAVTPLFLIAAALQPFGLFVFMREYFPQGLEIAKPASIVFGFMTLQQMIAFIATKRTSLLFFGLFFFYAFLFVFMNWMEIDAPLAPLILGITGLMVSWGISQTEYKEISSFFFFWSSIFMAAASFDYLQDTPFDVVLIGVSAGLIYLSTIAGSRTVLTVGVLSLLTFLGYFTDKYFKDLVGWPIAMIIMGFVMIAVSIYAVKLGKKIVK